MCVYIIVNVTKLCLTVQENAADIHLSLIHEVALGSFDSLPLCSMKIQSSVESTSMAFLWQSFSRQQQLRQKIVPMVCIEYLSIYINNDNDIGAYSFGLKHSAKLVLFYALST